MGLHIVDKLWEYRAQLVLIPFYPLLLMVTGILRLLQAFGNLVCLSSQPWDDFARMSSHRSLNSSWHRSYDLLMERYGRFGYAFEISLGDTLAGKFGLTKFSMRLYRYNEIVIPWLGVLIGVLSQLVWLGDARAYWIVLSTVLLGLISSIFYYEAFEAIKYDSLGWALVPLAYNALLSENHWWFSVLFLGITFLSVSVSLIQ